MSNTIEKDTVQAHVKYIRIAPPKLMRVAKLIRNNRIDVAQSILKNLPHKGAALMLKLLDSAQANAINNNKWTGPLVVSELLINEGPRLKRVRARARGRMDRLIKRTSHMSVSLKQLEGAA